MTLRCLEKPLPIRYTFHCKKSGPGEKSPTSKRSKAVSPDNGLSKLLLANCRFVALSLAPSDPGFDFSILSDFRQRLLEHDAADWLLEPILSICREQGWLKAGGKRRTNSTMVLAQVRSLSSLESVGENMPNID